ncbi:MAG: hypothetical protein QOC76_1121 [Mycobacterium sp.]|jgi:hypothetical protein|nr:hypothetical protein [Mycobacterium sp.]
MNALYLALAIPLGWAVTGYALVSAPWHTEAAQSRTRSHPRGRATASSPLSPTGQKGMPC